jgi:MoxR-like ATPase
MTSTADIASFVAGLEETGYVASRQIATALFLAKKLQKPIMVEGPAGVGKTELARATASYLGLELIRLQCYEGLDEAKSLYEWKYGKQLLYTQLLRDRIGDSLHDAPSLAEALARLSDLDDVFFSRQFLEPRPLLRALLAPAGAVLLIDEIDKSDDAFEAFLLELLAEYRITIPELGTIAATTPPLVLLTSNATRDLGDALRRRCLHLHIGFPDAPLEERIIARRIPDIDARLRRSLVRFVQRLRGLDLRKLPSVSETIDWARALLLLNVAELDPAVVRDTLNLLLKVQADIEAATPRVGELLRELG